jgi:DNA-cytosine methyltransferase
MKVLSLFDGMSCTQLALKNLGVNVETYYSSEIDKYAIQITQKNFPDTIQLGDIKDIKGEDLPEIDLIVAGSPCQGFSFAGKQLAFDDPRSALFFEFIRLLKEVKPKYFLLENVRMKKEHMEVINQQISEVYPEAGSGTLFGGVEPILINSALLSAQNRQRYYWTNIPNIKQPDDLGIVLRDILEHHAGKEHYAGEQLQKNYKGGNQLNPNYKSQANTIHDVDKKSPTISAGTHGYGNGYIEQKYDSPKQIGKATNINGYDIIKRVYSEDGKSPSLTTMQGGHRHPKVEVKGGAIRGRAYDDKGKRMDKDGVSVANKTKQMLELRKDDKSNAITTVNKDSLVVTAMVKNQGKEIHKENVDKSHCLMARDYKGFGNQAMTGIKDDPQQLKWRRLSPLECERLQTVPDNYTEGVSNSQRYKMLGNGFTVKVIEHILQNME